MEELAESFSFASAAGCLAIGQIFLSIWGVLQDFGAYCTGIFALMALRVCIILGVLWSFWTGDGGGGM